MQWKRVSTLPTYKGAKAIQGGKMNKFKNIINESVGIQVSGDDKDTNFHS